MSLIKIAISGTHGVGKTVMLYDIAKQIKTGRIENQDLRNIFDQKNIRPENSSLEIVSEVARKCPFQINKTTTEKSQTWIFLKQMLEELERESKANVVLLDRTIYDDIAYTNRISPYLAKTMFDFAPTNTVYDFIFFKKIKLNNYLIDDGVRDSTDLNFQKEIEITLENYYKKVKKDSTKTVIVDC